MIERIDSHHHFWRYDPAELDWIDENMSSLRRDFLPLELGSILRTSGIDATVAVQARQSLAETGWLLALAAESKWIRGVVGWAPIASKDFRNNLDMLLSNSSLKGLRHVIQAERDDNYILREDFNRGISALRDTGLVYDILILEKHLPQTIEFVDRHPNQKFVLDHLAKPAISRQSLEPWRTNIAALAQRENVSCKISGMVTEASWRDWTEADLAPYWKTILDAFGPQRLMFGSDWPVCLVASSYSKWLNVASQWTQELSTCERDRIMGGTAGEVYSLF